MPGQLQDDPGWKGRVVGLDGTTRGFLADLAKIGKPGFVSKTPPHLQEAAREYNAEHDAGTKRHKLWLERQSLEN